MDFEQIKEGDPIPALHKEISQEIIDRWADVSTDRNPLHVDPEFAKTTRFGGTIAHGHIALSFLCEMMHRWLGPGWISGGKLGGVKFIAPIRPGYRIAVKGVVTEKRTEHGKNIVKGDIHIENQDGEKCAIGYAEGVVND